MGKILKVEKGRAGDGSKKYVRIDSRDRMSIGVEPGDKVEIKKGNRKVTATVRKVGREYTGKGVIRLPEIYREKLGINVGEHVAVDKIYRRVSPERREVAPQSFAEQERGYRPRDERVTVNVNVDTPERKKGSILSGFVWMTILSILLFWLPLIGSFIAGYVGGKKAGGVGKALVASLIPAGVLAVLIFALSAYITSLPILGTFLAGLGFILIAIESFPLICGALIGGLLA